MAGFISKIVVLNNCLSPYLKGLSSHVVISDKDVITIVLNSKLAAEIFICNCYKSLLKLIANPLKSLCFQCQFYNNTMETLSYLDTLLPPESHVILMGLIDGSVLYKAMAKRFHPLGELRGDLVRIQFRTEFAIYFVPIGLIDFAVQNSLPIE